MSCYFIIQTYIEDDSNISLYDEYITEVKPIVESYGGKYLVRSNKVNSLHPMVNPKRVIIIEFPSHENIDKCFSSNEYKKISYKRTLSVDARAMIVEE
ncbi:MAG: DUF1330 domain-containing protein [Anaeroplasmataceae bacterium]